MSETKIVNRVSSLGLDQDLKDAGLETEKEVSQSEPQPEFVEGLGETKIADPHDDLDAYLSERERPRTPRDPDLVKFREQVIAAFKHLGLDTVKFFGA